MVCPSVEFWCLVRVGVHCSVFIQMGPQNQRKCVSRSIIQQRFPALKTVLMKRPEAFIVLETLPLDPFIHSAFFPSVSIYAGKAVFLA